MTGDQARQIVVLLKAIEIMTGVLVSFVAMLAVVVIVYAARNDRR